VIYLLSKGLTLTRQGGTLMPLNFKLPGSQGRLIYSTAELTGQETAPGIDRLTLKEDKSPCIEVAIQAPGILEITAGEHPMQVAYEADPGIAYVRITPVEPVVTLVIQAQTG